MIIEAWVAIGCFMFFAALVVVAFRIYDNGYNDGVNFAGEYTPSEAYNDGYKAGYRNAKEEASEAMVGVRLHDYPPKTDTRGDAPL